MTADLDDSLVTGDQYCLRDLIVGADFSEQKTSHSEVAAYAMAAMRRGDLPTFNTQLNGLLSKHFAGTPTEMIEIHAKTIWNGSERARSPFHTLANKKQMQDFLIALCAEVRQCKLFLSVATTRIATPHDRSRVPARIRKLRAAETADLKRALNFVAAGRLDRNVHTATGKHTGLSQVLMDIGDEALSDRMVGAHRKRAHMSEIAAVYGDHEERIRFYPKVDGWHVPADSRDSRLIQAADLACYFVGKHLTLAETVATYSASSRPRDILDDYNFSLELWDQLNLEVAMPVTQDEFSDLPPWLADSAAYMGPLMKFGLDACVFSLREASLPGVFAVYDYRGIGYLEPPPCSNRRKP